MDNCQRYFNYFRELFGFNLEVVKSKNDEQQGFLRFTVLGEACVDKQLDKSFDFMVIGQVRNNCRWQLCGGLVRFLQISKFICNLNSLVIDTESASSNDNHYFVKLTRKSLAFMASYGFNLMWIEGIGVLRGCQTSAGGHCTPPLPTQLILGLVVRWNNFGRPEHVCRASANGF